MFQFLFEKGGTQTLDLSSLMQEHHSAKALFYFFFWIMLENLIKQSSRDWPQKKRVQIKGKENVKVQQRRVKAPLIPITNMETTSAKPWEATYITWDPHKLKTNDEPQTGITTTPKSRHLYSQAPRN